VRIHENNLIKLNVEVFRSVDGYKNYAVSSFGRVKNTKSGRILKDFDNRQGYSIVDLRENGNRKMLTVHRLVACAFINNPNDKECVDHIDNNRTNNHISNLRFATPKENSQNRKLCSRNTSNIKGVYFSKRAEKWCARITIDGIRIHIGYYDDLDDAKIARVNQANKVFGIYTNACEKL
jgi:hypothetical protein